MSISITEAGKLLQSPKDLDFAAMTIKGWSRRNGPESGDLEIEEHRWEIRPGAGREGYCGRWG